MKQHNFFMVQNSMKWPSSCNVIRLRARRDGAALVIVLAALVLMTSLLVAFFASVSTERAAAKSSSQNNDARRLADSALNIVVAQIKDATTSVDSTGQSMAWLSQPGLVRTFTKAGNTSSIYKLYSCQNLRDDSGNFDPSSSDQVPADWYSHPALYTDLNAPAYIPDQTDGANSTSATYTACYPILDPASADSTSGIGVKGFEINAAPVQPQVSGSGASNQAPMPVQWLYVLQNGEIIPATAVSEKAVALTKNSASATNPIVGRVAFWTDDETCKVNINTAAGDLWSNTTDLGSYCDMPYAKGGVESSLINNQPVQHEYQRYPGHPATTYLSAVFPNILTTRNAIYDMVPKISSDPNGTLSSVGGTRDTKSQSTQFPQSDSDHLYASVDELRYVVASGSMSGALRPASLFTAEQIKQANFFLTTQSRAPDLNLFGKPRICIWPEPVDESGVLSGTPFDNTIAFCATVNSGSSSKPYYFVRNDSTSPTFDYEHFQRNKELYEYLQTLTSSPIPGFGGSFSAKYGSDRDQILTEIFDYVRGCINLVDTTGTAAPYTGKVSKGASRFNDPGTGSVTPIQISGANITGGTTSGFGRSQTLYTPNILLFALNTNVVKPPSAAASSSAGTVISGTWGYETREGDVYIPRGIIPSLKLVTTQVQAVFLLNSFSVGHGVVRSVPNLVYEVKGLDGISLAGVSLQFPASGAVEFSSYTPNCDYASGGFSGAGCLFYASDGASKRTYGSALLAANGSSDNLKYPFWSQPITLPNLTTLRDGTALPNVSGAEFKAPLDLKFSKPITLNVYAKDKSGVVNTSKPIQVINLQFKDTSIATPVAIMSGTPAISIDSGHCIMTTSTAASYTRDADGPMINRLTNETKVIYDASRGLVPMGPNVRGDLRMIAASPYVDSSAFVPADAYYRKSAAFSGSSSFVWNYDYLVGMGSPSRSIRTDDLTDGLQAGYDRSNNNSGHPGFPGSLIEGITYNINSSPSTDIKGGTAMFYPDPDQTRPVPMQMPDGTPIKNAALLTGVNGKYEPGDWDTGFGGGCNVDGPYINKADEGEIGDGAYVNYKSSMIAGTLFSPNRQVPSPVIFGSLSTGVKRGLPWQTLLFCPNPPAKEFHPGWGKDASGVTGPSASAPFVTPPDHLLLDLFSMPVVEPYAISEPFSTAGRINLNYQIAPFTYIKRNTGLQAVLRSVRINAIPTVDGTSYRIGTPSAEYRRNIDIDETLRGFDARFSANRPFRSASEICEMFLVPKGETLETAKDLANGFWSTQNLTGDNLREKPYAHLYSRLTTKSNTYTVHMRVQSLKKAPATDPNGWEEGKDLVVGEYRGAVSIERYIDPNDADIAATYDEQYVDVDQTDSDGKITKTGRLDPFYRIRIVSAKQFAP